MIPMRRLSFGLSRQLWVIEAGVFLNMLGYGAVFPFEIIYLHEARGFSLGVTGLVVGLVSGVAIFVAPVTGAVIDRVGAQATTVGAGLALAGDYGILAFTTTPTMAFAGRSSANPLTAECEGIGTPPFSSPSRRIALRDAGALSRGSFADAETGDRAITGRAHPD